jgi:xanthine dehydrogenase molybdopterin-binding subunit B
MSTTSSCDGMLFGDFVRSPYAHARVVSIDATAALKVPGVIAVLTAKDLEPLGLHWMPTLAGDKQMVLADGKVLFRVRKSPSSSPRIAMRPPTPSNSSRSSTKNCRS